ncbi:MAG: trpS [Bacteroidetes bacterium]|nr:trpS [Bacteroidota bacterium]
MRPTGKLHLGHLVGALENWVSLQHEYNNYHLIADYHALTTNLDSSGIYQNSIDMVIDWLAAGIDPKKSPIFRQSQLPAVADQGTCGAAFDILHAHHRREIGTESGGQRSGERFAH